MELRKALSTKALAAEFLGSAAAVALGTGASVLNDATGWLGLPGVLAVVGAAVAGLILLCCPFSGGHINPAYTAGCWAAGHFPGRAVGPYAAAQCLGAVLGSGLVRLAAPAHPTLGAMTPSVGPGAAFAVEAGLSFGVVMFGLLLGRTRLSIRSVAPLIGGAVAVLAYAGGPYTGGLFNPARAFGPAVMSEAHGRPVALPGWPRGRGCCGGACLPGVRGQGRRIALGRRRWISGAGQRPLPHAVCALPAALRARFAA